MPSCLTASPIRGTTQWLAVLGDPVAHTLSPAMHNAAFAHLGLDAVYLPMAVPAARLPEVLGGLRYVPSLVGVNLTIPHKQLALSVVTAIDDLAAQVGAVNTLKRVEDGWIGRNTDVPGFWQPLQASDVAGLPVLVLGTGGAARAIAVACLIHGCAVWVAGRDAGKVAGVVKDLTNRTGQAVQGILWSDLCQQLPHSALVVNATPVGLTSESSPLTEEDLGQLPQTAIVYDTLYQPRPTPLLRLAQAQGLRTQDGLAMLLEQGALAFEFWWEQPAPREVMGQALQAALVEVSPPHP
ncbi:MAG: shikimate dehydrogenase [Pseudanabaenaceae cyanobacterium]